MEHYSGVLVLLTSEFPYGLGETFLEEEIEYLSKHFRKIIIISEYSGDKPQRFVPQNCEVIKYNPQNEIKFKWLAILMIFHYYTWIELYYIVLVYKLALTKVTISTLLLSLFVGLKYKSFLKRILDKNKEQPLVFYSYWCMNSAVALALLKKEVKKIFCVSRAHRWDLYFEVSKYLPFRFLINKHINLLFPISTSGEDYIKTRWKTEASKVILSRLGVRKQTPIEVSGNDGLTLISCSSLTVVKRVVLIAYAIKELDGKIPITWIHIGDGPEAGNIDKVVKTFNNSVKTIFTGYVRNKEVFDIYHQYKPHVFVNVSESEGLPVSIMEAMSLAVPVVATNVGGTAEIVNNENGWLLRANFSVDELSALLYDIYKNKSYIPKKQNAYMTWKNFYDADINYKKFASTLVSLHQNFLKSVISD
ncbi:MAG: glycosyltransferase [Chitinophagales bacterium]|nr:glycosyltransferase [Chitinophagales bacterium]MDW8273369.1 glycosyltransferase [Chitinophagales bacterium]